MRSQRSKQPEKPNSPQIQPREVGLCALSRCDGVECRGLLFDVLATTLRAAHFLAVVFMKREYALEGLVAVVADVVVDGHGTPPVETTSF